MLTGRFGLKYMRVRLVVISQLEYQWLAGEMIHRTFESMVDLWSTPCIFHMTTVGDNNIGKEVNK